MSALSALLLMFTAFALQTNGQNLCSDYSVSVDYADGYEHYNVTLKCKYTANSILDYSTIGWDVRSFLLETPTQAYTHYNSRDDLSGPRQGFENRLAGVFDDDEQVHTLTILKANTSDNLTYWRCNVQTFDCTTGQQDSLTVALPVATFHNLTINANGVTDVVVNETITRLSEEVTNNGADDVVTCYALSDIVPQVSIQGIEVDFPQECVRVVGPLPQPWNCSVTGTIRNAFLSTKKTNDVYCQAQSELLADSTRPIKTKTVEIVQKYNGVEIGTITVLCIVGVAVICGVVFLVLKKGGITR